MRENADLEYVTGRTFAFAYHLCHWGASTLIWNDTLGRPNGVISAMTLPSTPKFDNAPRINPHGNHKN